MSEKIEDVIRLIQDNYTTMSKKERSVADYVLHYPKNVVEFTVKDLANESGVSEASVIRMCKRIGFSGYWTFRTLLARDIGFLQSVKDDQKENGNPDAINKIFETYSDMMQTIVKNLDKKVMYECVKIMSECNTVHIIASGDTSTLAQHMGFVLGRIGIKADYNAIAEYYMNSINLAAHDDIVVAISQSGITKAVIKGAELAKEKNIKVIALTSNSSSKLAEIADFYLVAKGDNSRFDYYKNYNHLCEMAVIEALLKLLTNPEKIINKNADVLEVLLSDAKL